jgi:pterin-4a-carbinolamine dehydratase
MNSVIGLMKDYFDPVGPKTMLFNEAVPKEVPIEPKKATWRPTQDGEALIRTYETTGDSHLRQFIDQLLAMQERIDHHAQILIDGKSVKVRVGTHTLKRITELDTEYAAEADLVFEETGGPDE